MTAFLMRLGAKVGHSIMSLSLGKPVISNLLGQIGQIYFYPDFFFLADSVDPDEMLHFAVVHLFHHCLPKKSFKNIQCTNGLALI